MVSCQETNTYGSILTGAAVKTTLHAHQGRPPVVIGIQAKGSTHRTLTSRGRDRLVSALLVARLEDVGFAAGWEWHISPRHISGLLPRTSETEPSTRFGPGVHDNRIHSVLSRGLPLGSTTSPTNARPKPIMVPNPPARMAFLKRSGSSRVRGTVAASTTVAFMSWALIGSLEIRSEATSPTALTSCSLLLASVSV